MFPEGTRSRDGKLGRMKLGVAKCVLLPLRAPGARCVAEACTVSHADALHSVCHHCQAHRRGEANACGGSVLPQRYGKHLASRVRSGSAPGARGPIAPKPLALTQSRVCAWFHATPTPMRASPWRYRQWIPVNVGQKLTILVGDPLTFDDILAEYQAGGLSRR